MNSILLLELPQALQTWGVLAYVKTTSEVVR